MNLTMSFAKWQPLCLGLNVINSYVKHEYRIYCSGLKRYDMHNLFQRFWPLSLPFADAHNLKITAASYFMTLDWNDQFETIMLTVYLTHWGRVTHICVSKLTIIGSNNGLSPGRRQAIIWTNAEILLIGPLGTNFGEFLVVIHTFSFNKMHLKMSSAKWRPFCLGLNVLNGEFVFIAAYGVRHLGQHWSR